MKNWYAKCAKFLDTDDLKQNLKTYIRHGSAILNEKIVTPKRKKMIIPRGIQPTTNNYRYLIITSSNSYKNNVLYY